MTVIYKPLFQAVFYGHMRENNWSHISVKWQENLRPRLYTSLNRISSGHKI